MGAGAWTALGWRRSISGLPRGSGDHWVSGSSCDVCGREPSVGIASAASGPMSLAYCAECISRGACALFEFHYLFDFVSTDGEGLDPCIQTWIAWRDGEYIAWSDYVKERLQGPVCLVHRVHCREWVCDLCGYEEASCCLQPMDNSTRI